MLDLRKMLTEILLQVTTQEIKDIATEVYEDEKSKSSKCVGKVCDPDVVLLAS